MGWGIEDATRPEEPTNSQRALSLAVAAVAAGLVLLPVTVALLVLLGLIG